MTTLEAPGRSGRPVTEPAVEEPTEPPRQVATLARPLPTWVLVLAVVFLLLLVSGCVALVVILDGLANTASSFTTQLGDIVNQRH